MAARGSIFRSARAAALVDQVVQPRLQSLLRVNATGVALGVTELLLEV